MAKYLLVSFLVLALMATPVFAQESLTCSVTTPESCASGTKTIILYMSAQTNAHAATVSGPGYGYVLCCEGVDTLSGGASGTNVVLRLSASTNAHAGTPTASSYGTPVYMDVDPSKGFITCQYSTGCGNCALTLSDTDNAHVSQCGVTGSYDLRMCCDVTITENQNPILSTLEVEGKASHTLGVGAQATIEAYGEDYEAHQVNLYCKDEADAPIPGCDGVGPASPGYVSCTFTNPWGDDDSHTVTCHYTDTGDPPQDSNTKSVTVISSTSAPTTSVSPDPFAWHTPGTSYRLTCNPGGGAPCDRICYCTGSGCEPSDPADCTDCSGTPCELGIPISVDGTSVSYYSVNTDGNKHSTEGFIALICGLDSVSISPLPGCDSNIKNVCEAGESVTLTAEYTGCPSPVTLQVDAASGGCSIEEVGGSMAGMSISCTSSPCSGTWMLPDPIPEICRGTTPASEAAVLKVTGNPVSNQLSPAQTEGSFYILPSGVGLVGDPPFLNVIINEGSMYSSGDVPVYIYALDEDLKECYIDWGEGTPEPLCYGEGNPCPIDPQPFETTVTKTYSDGTKNIRVYCTDEGGNTNQVQGTVEVDTTPPVISLSATTPTNNPKPTIYITGTGLSSCSAVGGATWNCIPGDPGFCIASTSLSEGPTLVTVTCQDGAGNTVSEDITITVDLTPPTCSIIEPSSIWSNSPFGVEWMGYDNAEIEPLTFEVIYRRADPLASWSNVTDLCSSCSQTACSGCTANPGSSWEFKCRVKDKAGNQGGYSEVAPTTINSPKKSFFEPMLPEWTGDTVFTVDYGGGGEGAPIQCFNVKTATTALGQAPTADVASWISLTKMGSECLSPSESRYIMSTGIVEGNMYWFAVRAIDEAGEVEPWPAVTDPERVTSTKIDLGLPTVQVRAEDQDGNVLEGVASGEDVFSVNIIAEGSDALSGVGSTKIVVHLTEPNLERVTVFECGPAEPVCMPPVPIDYGPNTQLEYKAEVTDKAGNKVSTDWFYVVTHPLANLVTHDMFLSLGSTADAKIQVRNLQKETDTITLALEGYEFAWFEHSDASRTSSVTVAPGKTETVTMKVISGEPGTYSLTLNSVSEKFGTTDSDEMKVVTNYPPSFPGIEGWAIILLITTAGLFYFSLL